MIRTNSTFRHTLHAALLCLAAAGSILLNGCASGTPAGPSGTNIAFVSGKVHGGQSPIQGSTVKLYHTNPSATAYGAAGIFIGSAVTDSFGNFSIAAPTYSGTGSAANSVNCPAGTQAYITSAGGYSPGQPSLNNSNLLLMAALGDCSGVSASTNVVINEVTTTAAAYALASFMTTSLDGSNSFYAANVSAPVANSTGIGSITPTTPAGLAHAFLNAAKLVNIATGLPYATTSAYSGGATVLGSVPSTELLTLGDIMQPCVNSASSAGGGVIGLPITSGGSGYGAALTISGGSGSGATGNAIVSPSGLVTGLTVTSGGTGYSPTITMNGSAGTGAVLVPSLTNGVVTAVIVEAEGSGYTPTVTIAPPPGAGTQATAYAFVSNGVVSSVNTTSAGSGYSSANPPTVTISSPISGTTATATASVNAAGNVSGLSLKSGGSGYGTLTVSSPVSGTTATLSYLAQAGALYSVSVSNGGSGYGPTVSIAGATGSGATATANVSGGTVTSLTLTGNGSGYPVPTVTVAPPASGTAATATATTEGGAVTYISLTSGGSGYTAAPAVSISAPASGTTATASATVPADASSANIAASSACTQLFTLTPSLAGNYPNNTLQAFINLARNPYSSSTANSGLFGLVSSSPAFQPTLASAPPDWALSIVYGGTVTSATTGTALPTPYWMTLDANDTAYLGANSESATTPAIYGIGSYGVSVPLFGATSPLYTGRGIAADALGNIWFTNNDVPSYLFQFSASNGSLLNAYPSLNYPFFVAVDAGNNVWVGHDYTTLPNLDEFSYTPGSGGSAGSWAANYTASLPAGPYGLAVDANQNIWAATYSTSGATNIATNAAVLPNLGTVAAPNYNANNGAITPVTAVFAGGAKAPYGLALDASGNAWFNLNGVSSTATVGIEEVVPNSTTAITSLTPGTFFTGQSAGPNGLALNTATVNIPAMDGAGTMFLSDITSGSGGIHLYSTITGNVLSPTAGIKSCLLATSASTACGTTTTAAVNSPHQLAVDSTGSLWAPNNTGGVTQIIGIAAPSFPLLSVGKPGLSPGLTAVNPLP
jgi:hypothetical protein